jgi:hypothetical protein
MDRGTRVIFPAFRKNIARLQFWYIKPEAGTSEHLRLLLNPNARVRVLQLKWISFPSRTLDFNPRLLRALAPAAPFRGRFASPRFRPKNVPNYILVRNRTSKGITSTLLRIVHARRANSGQRLKTSGGCRFDAIDETGSEKLSHGDAHYSAARILSRS